jgi:hypothetical protein
MVTLDGESFCTGWIQEMAANNGPCMVFIEEMGEKITVRKLLFLSRGF